MPATTSTSSKSREPGKEPGKEQPKEQPKEPMTEYLGKDVPEKFVKDLVTLYCNGFKAVNPDSKVDDAKVLERLKAENVFTTTGAEALGSRDARKRLL